MALLILLLIINRRYFNGIFQYIIFVASQIRLQKKEFNMAFVYKSPRNLNNPPQKQTTYESQNTNYDENKQNQPSKPKQPIKGLAQRKNEKENDMKEFYFVKDVEKMKQLQNKKIEHKVKNLIGGHQKEQYFFKSKCERGLDLVNSTLQQTKQNINELQNNEIQYNDQLSGLGKNHNMGSMIYNNKVKEKQKNENIKTISIQKSTKQQKLPCLMNKQGQENVNNSINLLHSKKKLNLVYTIPSIPGKDEQFGYVVKKDQLTYPTKVSKPRFNGEKGDMPGPTDYHVCHNRKIKGVLKFNHPKHVSERGKSQNDFYALINDQQALKMHNQKIKKWVQQGKKKNDQKKKQDLSSKQMRKLQTRDRSTASNQSGQTVYQFDTTPGPGYYESSCPKLKKNFRSRNEKFQKIFFSESQRFEDLQQSKIPYYNSISVYQPAQQIQGERRNHRKRKNKFFISKLARNTNLSSNSITPSPGHYNIRASMQNDLIANILRNSPNLFNNKLPRLLDCVSSIAPGPGAYCTDKPQFKIESFKPPNEGYQFQNVAKSSLFSQLKSCEKILLQNSKQTNQIKRIHQRQDSIIQPEYSVPFLSSTPKGLDLIESPCNQYKRGPIIDSYSPAKQRNQSKIRQNICPFNSTQLKNKNITSKYVAEVGLYELKTQYEWEKKSFNVLFN